MSSSKTSVLDEMVGLAKHDEPDDPMIDMKQTSKHLSLSVIQQRVLAQEFAEVQAASLVIFNYMKEVEVFTHRLVICAPYYCDNNPAVKDFIDAWNKFAERTWEEMKKLSVQDNPLGA
jgi:hypothetical protein